MSRKKRLPPGVQAHIDRINAANDLRTLNAIFNAIDAARASTDDRTAMEASDLAVWRAYRARHLAIAGQAPPIPADPCAPPDQQADFRAAVARIETIGREVAQLLQCHPNLAVYQAADVRALDRVLSDLVASAAPVAAKCRAQVRRSPFALIHGFHEPAADAPGGPVLLLVPGDKASTRAAGPDPSPTRGKRFL